ncbi:MAG: cell wall-binding repeat-containing protein [Coriobacteriales bacterium]|jgi:putative cell wall-binding protein
MDSTMVKSGRRMRAVISLLVVTVLLALTVSLVSTETADASSWVKEYSGTTVSKRTGISRAKYMSWLERHLYDHYYIGTPYGNKHGGSDHRNPLGDCDGKNGANDVPGEAGMNCTGFVWHTLYGASGYSLSKAKSVIPCWTGWGGFHRYAIWGSTPGETFNRFTELVDQGKVAKGDIIWIWNLTSTGMSSSGYAAASSETHHINVFVGDWGLAYKAGGYGLWHSAIGYWRYYDDKTGKFYRDMSYKVWQNTISAISPITYSKSIGITVLKFDNYKPDVLRKTKYKAKTGQKVTATPYAGETQYATNFKINYAAYPNGCDNVVVVSGKSWEDGLSAAALAGALNCPIVQTKPDKPGWTSYNMMKKLNPKKVYVIGGPKAVSWNAAKKLSNKTRAKGKFTRLGGKNAIGTSEKVYNYMTGTLKVKPKDVILATANDFRDAISASCYAAWSKSPILLTKASGPSAATRKKVAESGARLVVMGGPKAVPESAVAAFGEVKGGVKRVAGKTAWGTSAQMFKYAKSRKMPISNVVIATGRSYNDALAASALGKKFNAQIILLDGKASKVTPQASETLRTYGKSIKNIYFVGGSKAINSKVRNGVNYIMKTRAGTVTAKTTA